RRFAVCARGLSAMGGGACEAGSWGTGPDSRIPSGIFQVRRGIDSVSRQSGDVGRDDGERDMKKNVKKSPGKVRTPKVPGKPVARSGAPKVPRPLPPISARPARPAQRTDESVRAIRELFGYLRRYHGQVFVI